LKLIGCGNFFPRIPQIFSQAHLFRTQKSGGLKNYALLMPCRTKVLSTSFSFLIVPWTKNFGCKMTFLALLNF
jgi:hypothetical protein